MASLLTYQKPITLDMVLFQKLLLGNALKPVDHNVTLFKSSGGQLSFIAKATDPEGNEYTTFVKLPSNFAVKEKSVYFIKWHGLEYDLVAVKGFFIEKETKSGGFMYNPSVSN